MWDPTTGGGYDGLTPLGPNLNQGAESTLALISTLQHGAPPKRTSPELRSPRCELTQQIGDRHRRDAGPDVGVAVRQDQVPGVDDAAARIHDVGDVPFALVGVGRRATAPSGVR